MQKLHLLIQFQLGLSMLILAVGNNQYRQIKYGLYLVQMFDTLLQF
jgi:hypothetical protein